MEKVKREKENSTETKLFSSHSRKKMASDEKQISEHLVHNYLVKTGLKKIAGEFKKEVGIKKVTKFPKLEDIVLHYNDIAGYEKKLKLRVNKQVSF